MGIKTDLYVSVHCQQPSTEGHTSQWVQLELDWTVGETKTIRVEMRNDGNDQQHMDIFANGVELTNIADANYDHLENGHSVGPSCYLRHNQAGRAETETNSMWAGNPWFTASVAEL